MKVSLAILALLALVALPFTAAKVGSGSIATENTNEDNERKLGVSPYNTVCMGPTLTRGQKLYPNESICGTINGTMVWFGIRSYPSGGGYTQYKKEIWSANGQHDRFFLGIGTTGPAPYLQLQGDGNVVFAGQGVGCLAKPGKRGPNISMSIQEGNSLPDLVKVYDNDGDVIHKIHYKTLSNNSTYIGGSSCYPELGPRYVSVLKQRQRLTWNEYVCEFDASGKCTSYFGLDSHGLLALWRDGSLVWRPGPFHVRGDYLHLQGDGHLTLYRATKPTLTYNWASKCFGMNETTITVSGGNVHQFHGDGSTAWALAGEAPLDLSCFPTCSVMV